MSVLYLHFDRTERSPRVQKLARSGAHILVSEPRGLEFLELARREKPYAIAIDFSYGPSHALYTAEYLAKAKETREATIYLLRVPADKLEEVRKRLPQAPIISEHELAERLAKSEKEAEARAREKKEAAAAARKTARAKKAAEKLAASSAPPIGTHPKKAAGPRKSVSKDAKKKKSFSEKSRSKKNGSRPAKKK